MLTQNNENDRLILVEFWKAIPAVKKINNQETWTIISQEPRNSILKILSKGVEEEMPKKSGKVSTRRAMTIKEIHRQLLQQIDKKINLTNIYFHCQKLEEHGIIKEVKSFYAGRRSTTYFGRTAKAFFLAVSDQTSSHSFYQQLEQLLQKLNPDLDCQRIKELLDAFNEFRKPDSEKIAAWLDENNLYLINENIDFTIMSSFLQKLFLFSNQELFNSSDELKKLLKF